VTSRPALALPRDSKSTSRTFETSWVQQDVGALELGGMVGPVLGRSRPARPVPAVGRAGNGAATPKQAM